MTRFLFPSQAYNISILCNGRLNEISGSLGDLGDLGTLLPLLIALTLSGSIDLSSTLVFTGLSNILTGIFFGIPLPVQLMKAIAAIATSRHLSKEETASAGLFVAAVVGVLSLSGLLQWLGRVIPIPIVKGIQVGAGLSLVLSVGAGQLQSLGWTSPNATDNLIWAIAAFILLLMTTTSSTLPIGFLGVPFALLITVLGVSIGTTTLGFDPPVRHGKHIVRSWHPNILRISWPDFSTGLLTAGIGQLPLTILNSIIAVEHLAVELLPDVPAPSVTALGLSVTAMNLGSCSFATIPTCHGSGGLAGQYRFVARSGASVIILGFVKLLLGLVVSETWLVEVLKRFPKALLGIMGFAVGIELAKVGESLNFGARDLRAKAEGNSEAEEEMKNIDEQERKARWMVMMMTVAGLVTFKNDAVGSGVGLLAHISLKMSRYYDKLSRSPVLHSDSHEDRQGLLSGDH